MTQKVGNEGTQPQLLEATENVTSTDSQGRELEEINTSSRGCLSRIGAKIWSIFTCCCRKEVEEPEPVILRSSKPEKQEAEMLWKLFIQDPIIAKLPLKEQKKIFKKCLTEYRQSVTAYEKAAGEVAFANPKAEKFAKDLSSRLGYIVLAYNDVCESESPSKKQNPLFTKEFMAAMRLSKFLEMTQQDLEALE